MDLHVLEAGQGDPLLLVHGLGGAGASWSANTPTLSQRFHVLAPDLPGFGRSSKPERRYTPAFFVDTLVALLDQHGLESTHAVGVSMGGQVALELALRHPERVDRVIAVAPAGIPPASFEGSPALDDYQGILDARSEEEVRQVRQAIQAHAPGPASQVPENRSPEEILAYVRSPGAKDAFTSALDESASARRLGPLLHQLDPTPLFVWGDRDPIIPLEVCRPVLEELAGLELAVFPGCGHSPQVEESERFNEVALRLLSSAHA